MVRGKFKNIKIPFDIWLGAKHLVIDQNITLESWVAKALAAQLEKERSKDEARQSR